MNRRVYLRGLGIAGTVAVAGCTGSDEPDDGTGDDGDTPTEGETSTDGESPTEATDDQGSIARAAVGELVSGENLSMVVREVRRADSLGEFDQPDEGNVYVVVRLAIKNTTTDEFADFNSLLQTRLVDDEDFTYDQAIGVTTDRDLAAGQLAPGEVVRGDVVFEVPEDAAGLQLEFDFEFSPFVALDRVHVDLTETAASVADLTQELQVPIHGGGEAVERGGLTVELNEFRTATELDQFTRADEGNEYAIVDISVTNETGEEQHASILLQMTLKDGEGFTYTLDLGGYSALDRGFEQGSPIADGQTRRGGIAYQVPEGTAPLYFAFEFDPFVGGEKTFWQVR